MAPTRAKITKRFVDSVKATGSDQLFWDSELHRFGLRVTPSGVKSYIVQYRANGVSRRYTVGRHGPTTPELARKKASMALRSVDSGGDPAAEKREALRAPTVADLADEFLAEVKGRRSPATAYEYRRQFEKDLLPAIGRLKVRSVTQSVISRLHSERRDAKYAANRLLALASAFFGWLERNGHRAAGSNPCRGVERFSEQGRERFLTLDEIARIGSALNLAESSGQSKQAVNAIRVLLLSGFREMEVLSLRWDSIDFERSVISLPHTKTGKSIRLVGAPVLELLSSIEKLDENPHVFAGKLPGAHITTVNRTWNFVRKAAGIERLRLHDLRHTYASIAASGGASLPLIGTLLGHRTVSVTARYSHIHDHPARALADRVAGEVSGALAQNSRTGPEVMQFTKSAAARGTR